MSEWFSCIKIRDKRLIGNFSAGSSEGASAATVTKPPVKPTEVAGEGPPGPPRFSGRIPQLVAQLKSGDPDVKTGAGWALHDLAKGSPQQRIGDAVWEAEGVIPLVTMLSPADSPQAVAAAAAIGQLASADNKAFQVNDACSDQSPSLNARLHLQVNLQDMTTALPLHCSKLGKSSLFFTMAKSVGISMVLK